MLGGCGGGGRRKCRCFHFSGGARRRGCVCDSVHEEHVQLVHRGFDTFSLQVPQAELGLNFSRQSAWVAQGDNSFLQFGIIAAWAAW